MAKKKAARRKRTAKKKAARRKPYNKSTGRSYTGNSTDAKYGRKTRAARASRGRARTIVLNKLIKSGMSRAAALKHMKGKDVAHKDGNSNNNSPSNLVLQSVKKNRGRAEKSRLKGSKRS